jgi:hypothetical protein
MRGFQRAIYGPAPLPLPKVLMFREHFRLVPITARSRPATLARPDTPPPEGYTYTASYDLVRLPTNVVPPPTGFTSDERWHLGPMRKEGKDAETESVWTAVIA